MLALLLPFTAFGHEIPNDVTVQSWLRPEGQTLRVLLRVPLESMRDIEWPTRGLGYLEIEEAEPLLADAVTVWLANDIEVYEEGVRLPTPAIAATRLSLPSDTAVPGPMKRRWIM